MFHIYNGLEKSIKFLNRDDRRDFLKYVNSETKFYPLSIFILKKIFSKTISQPLPGFLSVKNIQ